MLGFNFFEYNSHEKLRQINFAKFSSAKNHTTRYISCFCLYPVPMVIIGHVISSVVYNTMLSWQTDILKMAQSDIAQLQQVKGTKPGSPQNLSYLTNH